MVTSCWSAPVLGVSPGYGWLPRRARGYWKVTYATKARVMLNFGQTLSLALWKRMNHPPHPPSQGNGVKGVGICSILLPFFGLAESPQQKQNAVTAQPKIGIWPSWGVQEPGAAVQYSMASWERELKITTRWLMILRAIVKLSSCDINQNMNISAVQGRKSPWRCTLGICRYRVARHGSWQFQLHIPSLWKASIFLSQMAQWRCDSQGLGGSFYLHKTFFNRTHLWYQNQTQHYLISDLFLIFFGCYPLQIQHNIFLNLAVLGFNISLPKANPTSTTFQLGFITIIINHSRAEPKILPSCTPWLLNSFLKQRVVFWDSQLLT